MKKVFESVAIFLVGLLTLGIVYLIIQYNMIDESNIVTTVDESAYTTTASSPAEGGEDIDAEIDAEIEAEQ